MVPAEKHLVAHAVIVLPKKQKEASGYAEVVGNVEDYSAIIPDCAFICERLK